MVHSGLDAMHQVRRLIDARCASNSTYRLKPVGCIATESRSCGWKPPEGLPAQAGLSVKGGAKPGQFSADVELDIENTALSPGVHRMNALVGQDAPFDHGREQMKLLAGLDVTTKSIERTAEAIGEDIAQREREEIEKAIQLDLPVVVGKPIPVLYAEMDGTGVPVVKKETVGRQGKIDDQPAHTREVKLGCVFT